MKLVLCTLLLLFLVDAICAFRSHFQPQKLRQRRIKNLRGNSVKAQYEDKWFTQKLDHSDPTNNETWQQRYLVSDKYFKQNNRSVIFLMISGESKMSETWMRWGFVGVNLSSDFSALFIQLEHRYYGYSKPKEDLTLKNLKYLTSEQALGDIANFISKVNLNISFQHPPQWVLFGGSYAGSLAAWSRLKHPNLVKGAVVSSAPMKASLNFHEYYEVVATDLKNVNKECANVVERATHQVESKLKDAQGRNYLYNKFKLCNPLQDLNGKPNTTQLDIMGFFLVLAGNFADIAQFNDETVPENLNWVCSIITNTTNNKTDIERLADFNEQMLQYNEEECLDYAFTNFDLKNVTYDVEASSRQWNYMTCNEFGFFQTSSNGASKIFGKNNFPLDFFVATCIDAFGKGFQRANIDASVRRTNKKYGGSNYTGDNAVFIYGTVDPWYPIGVLKSKNKKTKAILINGTSHGYDFYAPEESDIAELVEARKAVKLQIESWLS